MNLPNMFFDETASNRGLSIKDPKRQVFNRLDIPDKMYPGIALLNQNSIKTPAFG